MHIIAAKAVAFHETLHPEFRHYQEQVVLNARAMCQRFMDLGYKITSDGTDTHLFLVDLTNKGITGKDAETALDEIGIIVNKNTVPNDKRSPFVTSGMRIGSCAITTRGVKESTMMAIVDLIDRCLSNIEDSEVKRQLKSEVKQLCQKYPIYE